MDYFIYESKLSDNSICNEIKDIFNNNCIKNNYINNFEKINIDITDDNIWYNIKNKIIEIIKISVNDYFLKLEINLPTNLSIQDFLINFYINNENNKYIENNISTNYSFDIKQKKIIIINFILCLDNIDEGGEINILNYYKINCEKGKIILFPNDWFFPYNFNNPISKTNHLLTGILYVDI